jgi:ribosomal protein L11 methyltransferase
METRYDIIITPRMSFGTGHHATTYLVIEQMKGINIDKMAVLDFGTGTGVLAILAEKMGALDIDAIDNDEWSIRNAGDNIRDNNCSRIRLIHADSLVGMAKYDLILANINRNILLNQMEAIAQHLQKDGVVLMSGLLQGDQEIIAASAASQNLFIDRVNDRDGWLVLYLINK